MAYEMDVNGTEAHAPMDIHALINHVLQAVNQIVRIENLQSHVTN